MSLSDQFIKHWQKNFSSLTGHDSRVLVTVSGGVDSVVLLDLAVQAGVPVTIAHVNFALRGEESERDEQFVRSLGEKYGVELLVKKFSTKAFADEQKISIQEAARKLRYQWFDEIIGGWQKNETGAPNYILTAHHADDNIETMLMHFFRGTGLEGLTGIQPIQKERHLLRPLLPFHKTELEAYAAEKDLAFVEDSSNASDKYTRNFFRNRLIPQIREVFPQTDENLLQNIRRFGEAAVLYQQAVELQLKKLVEAKNGEWHVPVLKWKKAMPLHTITWELIKPYGFTALQAADVIRLLDAGNGAYISSSTHRIIHNRQWMIISPLAAETAAHIVIEKDETDILFAQGKLELSVTGVPGTISADPLTALIDIDKLQFPLLLRNWKTGDYFYPLGMKKKKKLSRFFIDTKLSKTEKEKTWVLESDKKIIWVLGQRIDDRYKITPHTSAVLTIHYRK